jgi:hypothetical protein
MLHSNDKSDPRFERSFKINQKVTLALPPNPALGLFLSLLKWPPSLHPHLPRWEGKYEEGH